MHDEVFDFPEFAQNATDVWDEMADWWDDKIGDGNSSQDELIEPTTERLLQPGPGQLILDIACGAGRMARRIADTGAEVVAFDQTSRFIERAQTRSQDCGDRIEYLRGKADDAEFLKTLGKDRFDATVCTMAIMDMAVVTPLATALPGMLKPGAKFVFSVTHPVFNSSGRRIVVEEEEQANEVVSRTSVQVFDYVVPHPFEGIGIVGQPVPHQYFHRPVSLLINLFTEQGFVLDRLEEPVFNGARANNKLTSGAYREFPAFLFFGMHLERV
jgi:2-polyprenyl-3-methyl-5-hydroxy-6-metoxy-1,4-benzoquinol methylase